MQKVIINKCFGGYGFVPFTIQQYADAKGIKLYWYTRDCSRDVGRAKEALISTTIDEINQRDDLLMDVYPIMRDMGDAFILAWGENSDLIFEMPPKEMSRVDPVLIEIIERYGDQNVHGCYAPKVVEVPDGVAWVVEEYDGFESLHEAHLIFG